MTDRWFCELQPAKELAAALAHMAAGGWAGDSGRVGAAGGQVGGGKGGSGKGDRWQSRGPRPNGGAGAELACSARPTSELQGLGTGSKGQDWGGGGAVRGMLRMDSMGLRSLEDLQLGEGSEGL